MLAPDHPSPSVRRWILVGYWAFIYFLTHWPEIDRFKPRPDWPFRDSDKVVHAGLYAGWVLLWWWVLSSGGRRVTRTAMIWLAVGAAGYSIFDELTQAVVGRQPDVLDFACDMVGVASMLIALHFVQKRQPGGLPRLLRSRAIRAH